ncbi:MAG: translocation/assembly module TamB domain-containing protein [Pseudomonadota bacterium]
MGEAVSKKRGWRTWASVTLVGVLALLLILVVAVRLLAMTSVGHGFVEARLEALSIRGQTIEINQISGDLLSDFEIGEIRVSDSDGIWLRAEGVSADWGYLSLLGGKLQVDELSAASIDVIRQPILAQARSPQQSGGGSFLQTYEVDEIIVDTLTVRAPLVPEDVTGSLSASLNYGGEAYGSEIDFTSLPAGRDQFSLLLSGDTDGLPNLQYTLNSAPGGLIAALARLGPEQSLTGEGQLSGVDQERWDGQATISIDGEEALLIIAKTVDGLVDIEGELRPDRHPAAPRQLISLGPLEFEAQFPMAAPIKSAKLSVLGDGVSASVSSQGDDRFDIMVTLQAPQRFMGNTALAIDNVRADGIVSIANSLMFEGALEAQSMQYDQYAVAALNGPVSLTYNGGRIDGTVEFKSSGIRIPQAAALKTADVSSAFSYADGEAQLRDVEISSQLLTASASADLVLRDGVAITTQGQARISGILIEQDVLDGARFKWSVNGRPEKALDFSLSGRASLKSVSEPFSAPVTYAADGEFIDLSQLTVERFTLRQNANRVSGALSYDIGGDLNADLLASVPGFSVGNSSITQANADLTLKLANGALTGNGFATADEIVASGQSIKALELTLKDARAQSGLVSLEVDLAAIALDERLSASATINTRPERDIVGISDLTASWGGLIASGEADLNPRTPGTSTAQFQITGEPTALDQIGGIEAALNVAEGQISGDLSAQNFAVPGIALDMLETRFEGNFQSITGNALIEGRASGNALDFSGPWSVSNSLEPNREISLSGAGNYGPVNMKFIEPLRISRSDASGWLGTGRMSLNGGTASFDLNADLTERAIVTIDGIPIAPFLQLSGRLPRAGALNGTLEFSGNSGMLAGGGALILSGLRDPAGRASNFTLKSRIDLTGDTLKLTLDETGLEDLRFNASLERALSVDACSLMPVSRPNAPLRYEMTANGNIGTLADLLLPATLSIDGDLDARLSGSSSNGTNTIEGALQLKQGEVLQSTLGLDLVDLTADMVLSEQSVDLRTVNARGRNGGTIQGGGSYTFGALDRSSSQITVTDLVMFDQDLATARVSGELGLDVTDGRPIIRGTLRVVDATVNIENLPRSGPPTLDVDFGDRDEETEESENGIIGLDIAVTSNRGITVQGRGVDALLSADIAIRNELVEPDISGTVSLVRGDFSLLGKRFDLQPSTLDLADPLTASKLDIEAEREDDGFVYTIQVTGNPERPEIALSSSPELPEDEVLSRILFGRSPSELTALEAAQLAAALAQLTGGGGFDLLGGLEDQLGLDRLSVNFNGSDFSGVTTGKYLADDVYVEVDTGVDGSPGLSIEWEPLDNVEVEVETVPGEGQALSVQWKRDFD